MLQPELVGLTRIADGIYSDDAGKSAEQRELVRIAIGRLGDKGLSVGKPPRILFCTRPATFAAFGFKDSAARTVDGLAILIGPRAQEGFYLEHELIHYWQDTRLGVRYEKRYPARFVEGMAYYLSDDPRHQLREPWES